MKNICSLIFIIGFILKVNNEPFANMDCNSITEPNNDFGNCNIGQKRETNSKCCWIKYKLGQLVIDYCQEISNDETMMVTVKEALKLKNYKEIDIQCLTNYLFIRVPLVFFILFIIYS